MNFNKSEALNISLKKETITQCQSNFPFKWCSDSITYLGIQIPTHLSNLYSKNYIPILHNIQKDLKSWSTSLFSWFGRAFRIKLIYFQGFFIFYNLSPSNYPKHFLPHFAPYALLLFGVN